MSTATANETVTIDGVEISVAQHAQLRDAFRDAGMSTLRANILARTILAGTINQNGVDRLCALVNG